MVETSQHCGCLKQEDHPERAFHWIGFLHCQGLTIKEKDGLLFVSPPHLVKGYAKDLIQRRKPEIIEVFNLLRNKGIITGENNE